MRIVTEKSPLCLILKIRAAVLKAGFALGDLMNYRIAARVWVRQAAADRQLYLSSTAPKLDCLARYFTVPGRSLPLSNR